MKLTFIGCTLLLCSSILYGFRYVAAAILNTGNAIHGPGLVSMDLALSWLGWPSQLIPIALASTGVLCIGLSLRRGA